MSSKISLTFQVFVFTLILLSAISLVSSITGSIGNARMILRVEEGDQVERSVRVKNPNNERVKVNLFPTGDLENFTKIIDESFELAAGEEKKAFFKIDVPEAGTTETNINVKFEPVDGGNGVGLSSKVIIIANESEGGGVLDYFNRRDDTEEKDSKEDDPSEQSGTDDDIDIQDSDESDSSYPLIVLIIIFLLVVVVLLILLLKLLNKKGVDHEKRGDRNKLKKTKDK